MSDKKQINLESYIKTAEFMSSSNEEKLKNLIEKNFPGRTRVRFEGPGMMITRNLLFRIHVYIPTDDGIGEIEDLLLSETPYCVMKDVPGLLQILPFSRMFFKALFYVPISRLENDFVEFFDEFNRIFHHKEISE